VGGPHEVSADISQDRGAWSTKASMSWEVFTAFQRWKVDSRPTPTFTRPSPTGKIQP